MDGLTAAALTDGEVTGGETLRSAFAAVPVWAQPAPNTAAPVNNTPASLTRMLIAIPSAPRDPGSYPFGDHQSEGLRYRMLNSKGL
ncbi:hypothetical protein GCM10009780_49440 [Actinomadura alba]